MDLEFQINISKCYMKTVFFSKEMIKFARRESKKKSRLRRLFAKNRIISGILDDSPRSDEKIYIRKNKKKKHAAAAG